MREWLLLTYKVPREPTSSRVYVWRKLKQLKAVLLHDALWVLPANERTLEQFQFLASEILELSGEATLARAGLLLGQADDALTSRFREQADELYRQILTDLKKKNRDLAALSRRFQQAQACDYFQSKLASKARSALLAARKDRQT